MVQNEMLYDYHTLIYRTTDLSNTLISIFQRPSHYQPRKPASLAPGLQRVWEGSGSREPGVIYSVHTYHDYTFFLQRHAWENLRVFYHSRKPSNNLQGRHAYIYTT